MPYKGVDGDGKAYDKPEVLWTELANQPDGTQNAWYNKAVAYWDNQEASVNGVLGGYGHVSDDDIMESRKFLLKEVDVIEPSLHYIETAKVNLCEDTKAQSWPAGHQAVHFHQLGLEKWTPEAQRYDVIWIQWALLYLTDDDAVAFFERCKAGLRPGGIVIVKENICKHTDFVVDKDDSSLTRSNKYMLQLFAKASMQVMHNVLQRNFPKELFPVRMYAIKARIA